MILCLSSRWRRDRALLIPLVSWVSMSRRGRRMRKVGVLYRYLAPILVARLTAIALLIMLRRLG